MDNMDTIKQEMTIIDIEIVREVIILKKLYQMLIRIEQKQELERILELEIISIQELEVIIIQIEREQTLIERVQIQGLIPLLLLQILIEDSF